MNRLNKILIAISAITLLETPAFADEDRHQHRGDDRHEHHERWHGDIHHFHEHDIDLWRGGHWMHDRHQGRFAWWWVVGGVWYAYQYQIFPYPDPYMPPELVVPQQPPVSVSPATQPAPNQFWYYCSQPDGYYPYIAQCQVPWQKVPASNPPDAPR
jgi:hypothetical protein